MEKPKQDGTAQTTNPAGPRDLGAVTAVTQNGRAAVTESGKGHGKTNPVRGVLA